MTGIIYNIRVFVGDILLLMALKIFPEESKESRSLAVYIKSFYSWLGKKVDKT